MCWLLFGQIHVHRICLSHEAQCLSRMSHKSVQTLDDGVIEVVMENVPILDDVSDDFAIRIPLTHAFFEHY